MNKDFKQTVNFYRYASKKMVALSFLAAVQAASCVNGKSQGLTVLNSPSYKLINLSDIPEGSPQFNKVQNDTANIVSEQFAGSNAQLAEKHVQDTINVFFQAIQKCDLKKVKSLLDDPLDRRFLTSKQVLEGLRLALKYKDTLSFRYKHKGIVHCLLREGNLSLGDLCAQDAEGSTLLHLLIKRGDIDGIRRLAEKLTLAGLCVQDGKGRTPLHLAACYKSKKIFKQLFSSINALDQGRAIKELFKKDKSGYSVIERGYLPKGKHYAALFNNSHIQLPTFCRKGSEMFKCILKALPVRLGCDQLVSIAIRLEEILEGKTIYKGYATTLRSILKRYIEHQYGCDADKVIQYVSHKRYLAYIEEKYGSSSEAVQQYTNQRAQLFATIEQKYGSKANESDTAVDEGYLSNDEI